MRWFWLILATLGLIAPNKVRAHPSAGHLDDGGDGRPPHRQGRRRTRRAGEQPTFEPLRSPCGRHQVAFAQGAIFVDGRRVHPSNVRVDVLATPIWRDDGAALAWIERSSGETRLVVLPQLSGRGAEPMAWPLPAALGRDRVSWAGRSRVVVGPEMLQPRAVASWTEPGS